MLLIYIIFIKNRNQNNPNGLFYVYKLSFNGLEYSDNKPLRKSYNQDSSKVIAKSLLFIANPINSKDFTYINKDSLFILAKIIDFIYLFSHKELYELSSFNDNI